MFYDVIVIVLCQKVYMFYDVSGDSLMEWLYVYDVSGDSFNGITRCFMT
jgi:hypothetical protein